jgi:hypothetical protein
MSVGNINSAGVSHPVSKDKASILNRKFQQASSEKIDMTSEECKMKGRYLKTKDINITEEGVLKQLNPYKSAGPDNPSPRVLLRNKQTT